LKKEKNLPQSPFLPAGRQVSKGELVVSFLLKKFGIEKVLSYKS